MRDLLGIPIFASPIILANIYGNEKSADIAQIATVLMLAAAITYQSYTFSHLYKEAIRRGSNYYSDDIEVDINWIIKSVIAIFTLEIICTTSTFFSSMSYSVEMSLTIYRMATIGYVFSQFVKFMKNFETSINICENTLIDEVDFDNNNTRNIPLTEEQQTQICKRLDSWIKNSGFTKNGVTIEDVAIEVATNRTYLSIYINTTFGCSFKTWITSLRVERAKRMLIEKDSAIIEISRKVGFSSPQSFMHSFKRVEGLTPTEWRYSNKKWKQI